MVRAGYGADMEMRELRYFVAVAEELHFGRAAERLGIAQPALSRALTGLEGRLGVALLERSSRRVRLTDAGAVLLTEARAILAAAEAAERRTREAKPSGGRVSPWRSRPARRASASAAVDLRRDLVAVPVTDAPPVTTVLAWPPESRSRPVADLVRVAATV